MTLYDRREQCLFGQQANMGIGAVEVHALYDALSSGMDPMLGLCTIYAMCSTDAIAASSGAEGARLENSLLAILL